MKGKIDVKYMKRREKRMFHLFDKDIRFAFEFFMVSSYPLSTWNDFEKNQVKI